MLRFLIFMCIFYGLDAAFYDFHMLFYMNLMLCCLIFTYISSCYMNLMLRSWFALAFLHELDATPFDLQLHFHMHLIYDPHLHFYKSWMPVSLTL